VASEVAIIDSRARFAPSALFHLWRYHELLYSLTVREVRARYRQSLLGFGWAVAQPLFLMLAFNLVFARIAKVSSDNLPYPIFSYAAMVPWTFLTNALNTATIGLVSQRSIVTKCYFPREIIVMSQVGARFVDFLAALAVYGVLLIVYTYRQEMPTPTLWLLFVPVLIVLELVLILALSLITSALHVRFRDLAPVVNLGLSIWLYVTPVGYPLSQVPDELKTLYSLNPMVGIIEGFRAVLAQGTAPDWRLLGISTLVSLLLMVVSYAYFKRAELKFADVI
jgi:lipopolysaccharide transport system permease protein